SFSVPEPSEASHAGKVGRSSDPATPPSGVSASGRGAAGLLVRSCSVTVVLPAAGRTPAAHDDDGRQGAGGHRCLLPRYPTAPTIPSRTAVCHTTVHDGSLPLDGSRGLAGHVQDHPVDTVHLVGDPVR